MFKVLNNMRLSPNFRMHEFQCNDGSGEVLLADGLLEKLQQLRTQLQRPVMIQSAYRNPTHNKKVGGSPNSRHLLGEAADIKVNNMRPKEVALIAEQLGFMGIGVYRFNGQSFIHLDVRKGAKSIWHDNPNSKTLTPVARVALVP